MIKFKSSVRFGLNNYKPEVIRILEVVDREAKRFCPDWFVPIVTSACDFYKGRVKNSKHPPGDAFDIGINGLSQKEVNAWYMGIKEALGNDYDVILKKDHIHIEFDPK